MPRSVKSTQEAQPATYEAALNRLDALIGQIESGQIPFSDVMQAVLEARGLMAYCQTQLRDLGEQLDKATKEPDLS